MSKEKEIIKILEKSCDLAIKEILNVLTDTNDPLVKTIAIRRWKNGYGFSPSIYKIGIEFKILGKIYHDKSTQGTNKKHKSELGISLTPSQKAEIRILHQRASLWVFKFWVSTISAKLFVKARSKKEIENVSFQLLRSKYLYLKHGSEFRKLLKMFLNNM